MHILKKVNISNIFKILVVLIIIFLAIIYCLKTFVYPKEYFEIITREAKKNNVDPYLILAIIKEESGFNSLATSSKNAKGLMQLMESTAIDINNKENIYQDNDLNLYNQEINIALGCKYFSNLISRYNGNYYLAVCAYNAGMGNVDKWISEGLINSRLDNYLNVNIPYKETRNYLKRVIRSYEMYRLLY